MLNVVRNKVGMRVDGYSDYGFVEKIENGYLYGWHYSGEVLPDVPVVVVGGEEFRCDMYRSDLEELGYNGGYCGFRIPVVKLGRDIKIYGKKTQSRISFHDEYFEDDTFGSRHVIDALSGTVKYEVKNNIRPLN